MSKITVPLLMVFAAIGFLAMVKLDHDGNRRHQNQWPAKSDGREDQDSPTPEAAIARPAPPAPLSLPERLTRAEFERETEREVANIRLIPLASDAYPVSFLWPTDENDEPAQPGLLEIARRVDFENWKSFTDEYVGFFYPDAPGVHVEVVDAGAPIPLIGEAMLPAGAGSFRRYRITAGEAGSLLVISLTHDSEFDDAPRAPEPEVFHRFLPNGGSLLRASFTARGQVRRVEVLGNGVRAALLDWPHLAIHQDLYLRIGVGLKLASPAADLRELSGAAIAKYGFEGRLGFLDHGIPEGLVIEMLGQPSARDQARATLDYYRSDGPATLSYHIPVPDGYFSGFGEGWREESRAAPEEGTLRWMVEKTDLHAGPPGGIGYDLSALTDAEAQTIFDRIVALAPAANPDEWRDLCAATANLAQHGLDDPRVTEIARAKLEAPGVDPAPALLALEASGSDAAKAAIAEFIIARFGEPSVAPDTLELIYTLLAYLSPEHPATASLVDRALGHQSAAVRELGFKYYRWLPEKYAAPHLEAGLHDPAAEIRRLCASAFATEFGDAGRHPKMLTGCMASEADEEVKSLLAQAIKRLGGDAGAAGEPAEDQPAPSENQPAQP